MDPEVVARGHADQSALPDPTEHGSFSRASPEQQLMSAVIKSVFRLNGQNLAIGEDLARPAGLTAARWLVLSAVLQGPATVPDIAREIGNTRQSVQRIADLLVEQGLAVYQENPAHLRSKLVAATDEGRRTVHRIKPAHAALAERLVEEMGADRLRALLADLRELSDMLDAIAPPNQD